VEQSAATAGVDNNVEMLAENMVAMSTMTGMTATPGAMTVALRTRFFHYTVDGDYDGGGA
jgi:hypothetical protein